MRFCVRLCRSGPPVCLNPAAKVASRRGRFSPGGDSRSRRPAGARAWASGGALAGPRVESGGKAGACSCRGLARLLPHDAPGPGLDPGPGGSVESCGRPGGPARLGHRRRQIAGRARCKSLRIAWLDEVWLAGAELAVQELIAVGDFWGRLAAGLAEAPRRARREAPETPEARRGARPRLNSRGANLGSCQEYSVKCWH